MGTNRPRARILAATMFATALTLAVPPSQATAQTSASQTVAQFAASQTRQYTVLGTTGSTGAEVRAAIAAAGGTVTAVNRAIGLYTVTGPASGFVQEVSEATAVEGAAGVARIGAVPKGGRSSFGVATESAAGSSSVAAAAAPAAAPVTLDPLDSRLWGLQMVRAPQARVVTPGKKQVLVGVLDTGLDASHPDIAPNFSFGLSRTFAPDRTDIDGPCEVASCLDPVGTDDSGHGTHVAGTIAAAANGVGVSGVAPNVTLVGLKAGQDSGFFFLEPVVNALTYAGDAGLDVVNLSFLLDPWLYACPNNAADSPAAQAEQRAIISGMHRALDYAHRRGVTLIGQLGDQHTDLGSPPPDTASPTYPPGSAYPRTIDNATCRALPAEGPHVIGVSAVGPSQRKADYSSYGREQVSVSAPGGFFRDGFGTPTYRTNDNEILSTYPRKVLQEEGSVDADGNVLPEFADGVFKDCSAGPCGYYTYLQGTSMAPAHATGVAALIVSKFGVRQGSTGFGLPPLAVQALLLGSAAERACPVPPLETYANEGRPAEFSALCQGSRSFNGFYGFGIVDAYAAVTGRW